MSVVDTKITKLNGKNLKTLHMLEMMNPRRAEDLRKEELSVNLKKVRDEREAKEKEQKAIE